MSSTMLPPPFINHIIDNGNPSTLYKLGMTNSCYRDAIWRRRGLHVDVLILRQSSASDPLMKIKLAIKGTRLSLDPIVDGEHMVILRCDIDDEKVAKLLKRVTVWKSVIIRSTLNKEAAQLIANTVTLRPNVDLRAYYRKFSESVWTTLLKMPWGGFDFNGSCLRPSMKLISLHSKYLKNLCCDAVEWRTEDTEALQAWSPESQMRRLTLFSFTGYREAKVWADFIENNFETDSFIEFNYYPTLSDEKIEFFERKLIKLMYQTSIDWAMVGYQGKRCRRLLIKMGDGGRNNQSFNRRFEKYVERQEKKPTVKPKLSKENVMKTWNDQRSHNKSIRESIRAVFQLRLSS